MAHSLEGCVSSLRETISLLGASISTLSTGVNDLPRLQKVLTTTRHFELVSESTLLSAQASLMDEITPEVESLFQRVEKHLEKMGRREEGLRAKFELNEGRVGRDEGSRDARRPLTRIGSGNLGGGGASGNSSLQDMKARQLRQKKERLSFAIDRLQMQASQKERQLRKSMAAAVPVDEDEGVEDEF